MTDAQKATLRTFFEETLKNGSLEFTHFLPEDPGTPITFKFREPPTTTDRNGRYWLVQYRLWVIRVA
jgi:hypothetical protein